MENFIASSTNNFEFDDEDKNEGIFQTLFKQYESVLVESLITSFGLDFIIKDQYGGDVDTIHNVRKVGETSADGKDTMTYKNKINEENYNAHGDYDSKKYHSASDFRRKNKSVSEQKKQVY